MNPKVIDNYLKLKPSLFLLPLALLILIALFIYSQNAFSVEQYIQIQKNYFIFINSKLSQFPSTIYNLTQLGDALVILSILTVFFVYVPKMWESLLSASIVSVILSGIFKNLFSVPRPAAALDNHSFVIIGKALTGHNSLPSGHSITVFTTLTVLLFSFMPKKWNIKILWSFLIISCGLILVFTRVGAGAHYPLDVITGSIVGYFSGLLGIFISRKYKVWAWIENKKSYPFFILLFLVCFVALINKIIDENLIVFYLPLLCLIVSLYKVIYVYVKK